MDFYTLRAPIDGRLSIVQAVPGQTLTPGTVVADVVDLEKIDVLCFAPPDTAALLALQQPAKLIIEETGPHAEKHELAGTVAFVGVQAQAETGNVPVKVRFPNPDLRLRANSIVRVHVLTQPVQPRLTIPETALTEDSDVPTVLLVVDGKNEKTGKDEKQVHRAEAIVGIRDREHGLVELLGLRDPETHKDMPLERALFVTAGGNGLHNDDAVKLETDEHKDDHKEKD